MGMGTGISGTSSRGLRGRLSSKRVLGVATIAGSAGVLLAAFSCGGTSGRGDLPPMPGMDATAPDTSPISYVDRSLPELGAPPSGGDGGAAYPWPSCPPFVPVLCPDLNGRGCTLDGSAVVEAGQEVDQLPSIYDDGGNVQLAPSGSACATYPWLGSLQIDKCVTSQCAGTPAGLMYLPPCNWCVDAGTTGAGIRMGDDRLQVCLDLYQCIVDSGCGSSNSPNGIQSCLCGDSPLTLCDASGPCAQQELAALEPASDEHISTILQDRYFDTVAMKSASNPYGSCAGPLNQVYQCGHSNSCFVDASAY